MLSPVPHILDMKVAELLLTTKAGVNDKNNEKETPLQVAVAKDNKDVAELPRQPGGY